MTLTTERYINVGIAFASFVNGEEVGNLSIDNSSPPNLYRWYGSSWTQIGKAGQDLVSTAGAPGALETRTLTIGADTDCFTDKTAPVAAELITCTDFGAGKKRCRVTWHSEQGGVPFAAVVVGTLNASDDTNALDRLTYADVSAGGTANADTAQRMISKDSPIMEWNLEGTGATVDRLDFGGYLADGTGAVPVYLSVEVW